MYMRRTVTQALITSRLDYGKALYPSISNQLTQRLQTIQNSVATHPRHHLKRSTHSLPDRTTLAAHSEIIPIQAARLHLQSPPQHRMCVPQRLTSTLPSNQTATLSFTCQHRCPPHTQNQVRRTPLLLNSPQDLEWTSSTHQDCLLTT